MATRPVARPTPSDSDLLVPRVGPGVRLGRYELLSAIAAGGMAEVWTARMTGDHGFKKLVALKTIRPEYASSSTFRRMFLDEAHVAARIRHANVVEVLDLGEEDDVVFQAMTLIEGASLATLLTRAQLVFGRSGLPPGVASRIVGDMLRGLHAAHGLLDDDGNLLGLVHRDVSPQNVLVGIDGIAKLSDFGIAKAFGRITEETTAGYLKGKARYLAPELLIGLPPTPQSDIFAAGVVLWEALTGTPLFEEGVGPPASIRKRVAVDPRVFAPQVPEGLAAAVLTALAPDPAARFPTARDMADALEAAMRRSGVSASHEEAGRLVEACIEGRVHGPSGPVRGAHEAAPMPTLSAAAVDAAADRNRLRLPVRLSVTLVAAAILALVALALALVPSTRRASGRASAGRPTAAAPPAPTAPEGEDGGVAIRTYEVAEPAPIEVELGNDAPRAVRPTPTPASGPRVRAPSRPPPAARPTASSPATPPSARPLFGNPYAR